MKHKCVFYSQRVFHCGKLHGSLRYPEKILNNSDENTGCGQTFIKYCTRVKENN